MTKTLLNKTFAAAVAIALAAGSFATTSASASDRGFAVKPVQSGKVFGGKASGSKPFGHRFGGLSAGQKKAAGVAALVGIGGALLGAAIADSQTRHVEPRRHGVHDDGFRQARFEADVECYDKPVKRFDRISGTMVIVGTKEVCN